MSSRGTWRRFLGFWVLVVLGVCVLGLTGWAVSLSSATGHSHLETTGKISGGSVTFTKTGTTYVTRINSVNFTGYWISSLTADNATCCYEIELLESGTAVYKTQVWRSIRRFGATKVFELWKSKPISWSRYTLGYKITTSGSYSVRVRIIARDRIGGEVFRTDWSKTSSVRLRLP